MGLNDPGRKAKRQLILLCVLLREINDGNYVRIVYEWSSLKREVIDENHCSPRLSPLPST